MAKSNPYLKKPVGPASAPRTDGKRRHGLGRGLDSLLGGSTPVAAPMPAPAADVPGRQLELPVAELERSPFQPRQEFGEEELRGLADSMKNSGLVQPPTVRKNASGRYEIIVGERRVRAAQLLGWKKIPVTLVDADDLTAASMTTTENIQREDLNPIEEAVGYRNLQDKFGLTQQEVAERVGKGRATVANSVRLLELPDEVKALVQTGLLSAGHAKALLALDGEKERVLLARDCVNSQLTVRALEKKIARLHAPVPERSRGTPDIPDSYARSLAEKMKRHLGCAVRLTSGVTHANGRHTKGVLEIDFFNNDDLDRIIAMMGLQVD